MKMKKICELSRIELPAEFNPFIDGRAGGGGAGGGIGRPWNNGRRQLYSAIMLFITKYDSGLNPKTAIFKVKERVESDVYSDVELRDVKAVNTILGSFHTTLSQVITGLAPYGKVRNYRFNILIDMINHNGIVPNNYM